MRAELRALGRVQAALEQRAEDAGLDRGPVGRHDAGQHGQRGLVQRQHAVVVEQAAVEVGNLVHAEPAARAHGREKLAQLRVEGRWLAAGALHQPAKQPVGQQPHVLGEEAEEQADQEVGHGRRGVAGRAQPVGQLRELAGHALRDPLRRLGALEMARVAEDGPQAGQPLGRQQVVQGQRRGLVEPVDEVGVDDDGREVGDHQQGRVVQRLAVLQQLLVGPVQVGVLALVLPAEAAALEDVGEALLAVQLGPRRTGR